MLSFLYEVVPWGADPVAFVLPFIDIAVRWYGLVYAFGALGAMWIVPRIIGFFPHVPQNLPAQAWEDFVFWTFVWGVIGGRVLNFVFYDPGMFLTDPLEVLKIWHGGMSIHGGLIGAFGFIAWWSRQRGTRFWACVEVLALPMAIILIFGRLANYANGEIVGTLTDGTWGMVFPHIDDLPRHPVQLYSAVKNLLVSLVLAAGIALGSTQYIGRTAGLFAFGYGALRAAIAPVREPAAFVLGLPVGQVLSLVFALGGITLIFWSSLPQQKTP